MPDSPPTVYPAPTSADLPAPGPSERQPHISAPPQLEEAKEIDLYPARDTAAEEAGLTTEASGVATEAPKPKSGNETGMSATSGPMGDHMAEVWRDSDVGTKEGRPVDLEGMVGGIAEAPKPKMMARSSE